MNDQSIDIFESMYPGMDLSKDLYPLDKTETEYCGLSGEPFAEAEGYFYLAGEKIKEKLHEKMFTEEEWEELYSDEFYYSEIGYASPLNYEVPQNIEYNYGVFKPIFKKDGQEIGNLQDIALKVMNDESIDEIKDVGEFLKEIFDNYSYRDHEKLDSYLEQYAITSEYPDIELSTDLEVEL